MTPRLPLRPKVKPMIHCYPSPRAAFSQTINSKRSSSSNFAFFLFFCALSTSWQIIGCDRPSSIVPVTGTVMTGSRWRVLLFSFTQRLMRDQQLASLIILATSTSQQESRVMVGTSASIVCQSRRNATTPQNMMPRRKVKISLW